MRKPPGLRLRFRGAELEECLEPTLVAWLEQAVLRNEIRSFHFARYEPEQFRFGGSTGMAIAHQHFDLDSRAALRYETLTPDDRVGLPRDRLSLALTNDLFRRCVDDDAELWDIWQRLRRWLGQPALPPNDSAAELEQTRDAMNLAPSFMQELPAPAVDLVREACAANEEIAARLHAAERAGRLTIGTRAWLAAVSIFHWNRLGLNFEDRGRMISSMLHLLDPHGDVV
jgi:thiopeptide-type bacteriocin biosynthesis protein